VLRGQESEEDSLRAAVAGRILFPDLEPDAKHFEVPPCVAACPLSQDVPGYMSAIAGGDAPKAMEIILRTNPLPSVLGRVCLRPCMKACIRGQLDKPPDIRGLKHYAASAVDSCRQYGKAGKGRARARAGKVAIIGAGPAGLAAAARLLEKGFGVTLYEKNAEPGGMLRYALAQFDLPSADLKRDVDRILEKGADLKTGVEINSLGDLPAGGADAVIIATGAPAPGPLFEHSMKDIRGARDVVSFMGDVRRGKITSVRGNVVVEGYAAWAVTAARAAVRLGAKKVTLLTPFPPDHYELAGSRFDRARREGVEIVAPARVREFVQTRGRLAGIECTKVSFGRMDIRGRLLGEKSKSSFLIRASLFIDAMDRRPDCSWVFDGGRIGRGVAGSVLVDHDSLKTAAENVFAAGDVVTGPRSVLAAVAMGVKAAGTITGGW